MRQLMLHRSARHFGTVCLIVAILYHSIGVKSLSAETSNLRGNASATPDVVDLRVDKDGTFCGRLVTPRGNAVSGANVELMRNSDRIAAVKTDPNGYFVLPTPLPGVYHVSDGTWIQSIRIWASGTAPPAAIDQILIVAKEPIIAGQVSPLRYWMANPNVMLATAAIAIAVPVLIYRPASD